MPTQLFVRIKLIIALLTTILLFGFKPLHPFYLGITHLKQNTKTQTLETSVKLFVNDLEETLRKLNSKPIDLINGTNKVELNKLLESYLKSHFKLKLNGKEMNFSYVGFEIEKDVAWIFVEYKQVKIIKTVEIENSLLYDHFKQQTNIVRLEANGSEQNNKLNYPDKSTKFIF